MEIINENKLESQKDMGLRILDIENYEKEFSAILDKEAIFKDNDLEKIANKCYDLSPPHKQLSIFDLPDDTLETIKSDIDEIKNKLDKIISHFNIEL